MVHIEGHRTLVKSSSCARYLTAFQVALGLIVYVLKGSTIEVLAESSGRSLLSRLSKWRTVPTTLHIPVLERQGRRAPKNHLRNFSRLSLFNTCSSPSRSSHTIRSGLKVTDAWGHLSPRTLCSAPRTKIRAVYPSLNSTMTSVSVSFLSFLIPNNSMRSSLLLNSSLMSFRNSAACVSVSLTITTNFLVLNNTAAKTYACVTAVLLPCRLGAAIATCCALLQQSSHHCL